LDQQQAIGDGGGCPGVFGGDDSHLILPDLDPGLPDAHCQPTFEHVERHGSSLVVFVQRRASPERQENQPKGPGLDQRAGVAVTIDVGRFRA
jgi:hypothetical protein